MLFAAPGHYSISGAHLTFSNLYRRPSGVYVTRIVIPSRHRAAIGKGELHVSTGTQNLSIAKAVAAGVLAHWREKMLRLEAPPAMNLDRVVVGSPLLSTGGYLPLDQAGAETGIEVPTLLRLAASGHLALFAQLLDVPGYLAAADQIDAELSLFGEAGGIPRGPLDASYQHMTGVLGVEHSSEVAARMIAGPCTPQRVFRQPGGTFVFVADSAVDLTQTVVCVDVHQVNGIRGKLAARVTPAQLADFRQRAAQPAPPIPSPLKKVGQPFSKALEAYMVDKRKHCAADHARRIESACRQFAEFNGDLPLAKIDRDMLRKFTTEQLPTVPAQVSRAPRDAEGKVPADWPRLSANEQHERVRHLCGLFSWLEREGWTAGDPSKGLASLAGAGQLVKRKRDQDARSAFTDEQLRSIFSADWFVYGRGELTKSGTYRTFLPHYYWLPLLGLFTGARINELSQLRLADFKQTESGIWFVDVDDDGEGQRLKNANSRRQIPLHPRLISLGLVEWTRELDRAGYDRLFPELLCDPVKGYGKAATKWFSRYLEAKGWTRDGTTTFHSFRHTFITRCLNSLSVPEAVLSQITGHQRGASVMVNTYRKDKIPDEVVKVVERLDFNLPTIAKFDIPAGLKALADASRRKTSSKH